MFLEIDGLKVNYVSECKLECEPDKVDTILIIHGWGCNIEVYRGLIDFLSEKYRVIMPELAGFGQSAEPCQPFGVDDYKHFIINFCQKIGLSETNLFCHSLGGRIAIKMLSDEACPIKINKVIFTGAAGIKPKRGIKAKLRTFGYKAGRKVLERFKPDIVETYRKKHGSADYNAATPVMRQSLVRIVNEDLKPLLPKIRHETLLIWGEKDDQTPLSDGKTMERLMQNAGLAIIKNSGHYAFLEQPVLFKKIINSYLH